MKPLAGKSRIGITMILVAAFLLFAASWGYWKFQYSGKPALPVINLEIPPGNRPVVDSYLPEQRRSFALEFGNTFKDTLSGAAVTTRGAFHRSIVIRGSMVNEPLVLEIKGNAAAIHDLRKMGFTHLFMSNDTTAWDVDLKN